jgi:GNAT superfamily N-acetyltransferase
MAELNRTRRQTLRRIQDHINVSRQRHGVLNEQTGVMDIYFHPTDDFGYYNYVMPRRGVAWVPGGNILDAFDMLGKHHTPHMTVLEELFPPAWHQQVERLGLERAAWTYPLLTYGVVPDCDQQPITVTPALPTPSYVSTLEAADPNAVIAWLRMHRRPVDVAEVSRSWSNVQDGHEMYLLAADGYTLAGGVMLTLDPPLAGLAGLYIEDSHRGRGVGTGLLRAAVERATQRGCTLIYAIGDCEADSRLYRRLGFVDLDSFVVYNQPVGHGKHVEQSVSEV